MNRRRIAHAAPLLGLALALALLASPALGAQRVSGELRHNGSGTSGCTRATPGVAVQNTYGWGQFGSWGLAGQRLGYQVRVDNLDVGCGSTTFNFSLSAPSGFTVEVPTSSVSLRSGRSTYLWAYVTSPSTAADGDYPLTATVTRSASGDTASQAALYKVYSSDSTPPTLFFSNPSDGETLSGSSYTFAVWSNDDHAVQRIELSIDGVYRTTVTCDDIAYNCALSYRWSLRNQQGQHTATFKSYDWMGNVGVLPVTFNVS
jgi:Bacterial Ig domain/NPCBM-associated, NEW3 domain of alpha-galactosidase